MAKILHPVWTDQLARVVLCFSGIKTPLASAQAPAERLTELVNTSKMPLHATMSKKEKKDVKEPLTEELLSA